jgi:hypothetical protein
LKTLSLFWKKGICSYLQSYFFIILAFQAFQVLQKGQNNPEPQVPKSAFDNYQFSELLAPAPARTKLAPAQPQLLFLKSTLQGTGVILLNDASAIYAKIFDRQKYQLLTT